MSEIDTLHPYAAELARLRELQPSYQPNPTKLPEQISSQTVVAIVGPSGTGKSALSDKVMELDPTVRPVGTRTTRDRRPNDPDTYKTSKDDITIPGFIKSVEARRILNFTVFGDNVYGTEPEDLTGSINIGPITSDSIPSLMAAGFKKLAVVYPLVSGKEFKRVLVEERSSFPDFTTRVEEGRRSLNFARQSLGQPWFHPVYNSHEPNGLLDAADEIISIAYDGPRTQPIDASRRQICKMDAVLRNLQDYSADFRSDS